MRGMKRRNILMPGTRESKDFTHFTEVSKKSWCSQSQSGFLCAAVVLGVCAHFAFLVMVLLPEMVLFKEFFVFSTCSCI